MHDEVNPPNPPEPGTETQPKTEPHPEPASETQPFIELRPYVEPEPVSESDAEAEDEESEEEFGFEETEEAAYDWKEPLREQFESWLESVDELSEVDEETEAPDLYSLYEQFVAFRNESRTGNRKSAEVFSRFGESLANFDGELKRLREQGSRIDTAQSDKTALPRPQCLALVEMLDRMLRLRAALARRPAETRLAWFRPNAAWKAAWENVAQGFAIVTVHLEKLLENAGVRPISTLGEPFDPIAMVAVAIVSSPGRPENAVMEEVSRGYRWRDEVLRPAEVKINKTT